MKKMATTKTKILTLTTTTIIIIITTTITKIYIKPTIPTIPTTPLKKISSLANFVVGFTTTKNAVKVNINFIPGMKLKFSEKLEPNLGQEKKFPRKD